MEEEKAAAYYDELTRKGEGAARFKQGLGFSNDAVPPPKATSSSSSSFLSNFVRASSPSKTPELEREAQLLVIQNKLKKNPKPKPKPKPSSSSSASKDTDRHSSGAPIRDYHRKRERRKRSRSRSVSDEDRSRRRSEKMRADWGKAGKDSKIDYSKSIKGYHNMSPAERVKAKMKLQLSETAKKDATKGMGSEWERFDFNKDAPLDDEEIEVAEDDAELVKHIGQSFRFSAVEAKREDEIKTAHDEAMFGTSSVPPAVDTDSEVEDDKHMKQSTETVPATNLISDQVLTMQRGSWRDRVRKS